MFSGLDYERVCKPSIINVSVQRFMEENDHTPRSMSIMLIWIAFDESVCISQTKSKLDVVILDGQLREIMTPLSLRLKNNH